MNLADTTFDIDGVDVRFEVEESVVTVWAYKEKTSPIMPRPAWIEVAQFDLRDYVGRV